MPSTGKNVRTAKKATSKTSRPRGLQPKSQVQVTQGKKDEAKDSVRKVTKQKSDANLIAPVESVPGDRTTRLTDETINRLPKAEIRAIGYDRGYWGPDDTEHRLGGRGTRAAFIEAQKKDKLLKGKPI